jgi:NAD(P)-dependent dehydrogenase (short-subunit alcohol dehydrogenase family)
MINLSGKRAVVTGGRRGIGRALALALLDCGANVNVIARSSDRGGLPNEIEYIKADLKVPEERHELLKSCGQIVLW